MEREVEAGNEIADLKIRSWIQDTAGGENYKRDKGKKWKSKRG
jgi:hypothetical protein